MKEQDYKEKVRIANQAIEGLNLDDNLKLKAFEKILDNLLSNESETKKESKSKKVAKAETKKETSNISEQEQKQEDIFSKINAEDFPEIHNLNSKLDICLYLLKGLREKQDIDGLIPSQIAKILTDKFRIKADQFNIGMALSKARELLDRDKIKMRGGTAYKYRIMKKGEEYILNKISKINNQSGLTAETSNTKHDSSNVSG